MRDPINSRRTSPGLIRLDIGSMTLALFAFTVGICLLARGPALGACISNTVVLRLSTVDGDTAKSPDLPSIWAASEHDEGILDRIRTVAFDGPAYQVDLKLVDP